jgi:hypothetical protein
MLYLAEPKEGLLFIKLDVPIQLLLLGRCGFYLGSTDFLLKTLDRPLRGRSTDTQCSIWQNLRRAALNKIGWAHSTFLTWQMWVLPWLYRLPV